jgi:hypothetical protein
MSNIKYTGHENAPNWTDKSEWDSWFKAFCQLHFKDKRQNNFDIVFNDVVKLITDNDNDKSKRVKGIKPRVLIRLVKERLGLTTAIVSRAIRKLIAQGILQKHRQTQSLLLIIKGHYWNSYVKQ